MNRFDKNRKQGIARREAMAGALAFAALPAAAQQATGALAFLQAVLQDGASFDPAMVTEAARLLAQRAYAPPAATLPEPFSALNLEGYSQIRHRPERHVWVDDSRGVSIEPLHRGFAFAAPVAISVVEEQVVRKIVYDPNRFSFGRLTPPGQTGDIGFSGFRLHAQNGGSRELLTFQGGTSFRAIAKGQTPGVMSRALALKTADARGEEFPLFRAFWIEKPNSDGVTIIHAIADSESCTAAYRFVVRQSDVVIMDTEATIFARAAMDHVGVGSMQASFLHGSGRGRATDDVRSGAHDVNGLQMLNGREEWIWRPVKNPTQLQISSFMDENPKGFGLVQRERDFAQFRDEDQRFELKPSLWIEPIGDWGAGSVQLVEIPSDSDVHDNVVAYWRPRQPMAAGSETRFAYRQFWCWTPPERSPLAQTTAFRIGRGSAARRRRFMVEFAAEAFATEPAGDLKLALSATPGQIMAPRLVVDAARKSARVHFELDPGAETACELRLQILRGERLLTETWLYRWTS
jgi:glucans biosynthesis protein